MPDTNDAPKAESKSEYLMLPADVNPNALFMLWTHFGGDSKRTSAATGVSVAIIESLAHDFQWKELSRGRLGLKDEKLEREVNRAHNYVQSQRIRKVIDLVVQELESNPAQLQAAMRKVDEEGNVSFSAKALVELAKAAEAAQNMSYRALGDKVANEADTTDKPDSERIKTISLQINTLVQGAADKLVTPARAATVVKDVLDV